MALITEASIARLLQLSAEFSCPSPRSSADVNHVLGRRAAVERFLGDLHLECTCNSPISSSIQYHFSRSIRRSSPSLNNPHHTPVVPRTSSPADYPTWLLSPSLHLDLIPAEQHGSLRKSRPGVDGF